MEEPLTSEDDIASERKRVELVRSTAESNDIVPTADHYHIVDGKYRFVSPHFASQTSPLHRSRRLKFLLFFHVSGQAILLRLHLRCQTTI